MGLKVRACGKEREFTATQGGHVMLWPALIVFVHWYVTAFVPYWETHQPASRTMVALRSPFGPPNKQLKCDDGTSTFYFNFTVVEIPTNGDDLGQAFNVSSLPPSARVFRACAQAGTCATNGTSGCFVCENLGDSQACNYVNRTGFSMRAWLHPHTCLSRAATLKGVGLPLPSPRCDTNHDSRHRHAWLQEMPVPLDLTHLWLYIAACGVCIVSGVMLLLPHPDAWMRGQMKRLQWTRQVVRKKRKRRRKPEPEPEPEPDEGADDEVEEISIAPPSPYDYDMPYNQRAKVQVSSLVSRAYDPARQARKYWEDRGGQPPETDSSSAARHRKRKAAEQNMRLEDVDVVDVPRLEDIEYVDFGAGHRGRQPGSAPAEREQQQQQQQQPPSAPAPVLPLGIQPPKTPGSTVYYL